MAAAENARTYYSYTDAEGVPHIVDSLDKVPKKKRAEVKSWTMQSDETSLGEQIEGALQDLFAEEMHAAKLAQWRGAGQSKVLFHGPSFALGVGFIGLLLGAFFLWRKPAKSRGVRLLRGMMITLAFGLLAGGYISWLRLNVGNSATVLSAPATQSENAPTTLPLSREELLRKILEEGDLKDLQSPADASK